MGTSRETTRQLINNRYKEQLVPGTDYEMDNYLDSINSELTQPLRIRVPVAGSYTISVEKIDIQNPETLVHRTAHPIRKKIPVFTGGTITVPNTTGNAIVVAPGSGTTLEIPNDEYAKLLIQVDDQGAISTIQGFANADANLAPLPTPESGKRSVGYVLLHMGAGGVLDLVTEEDVWQFYGPEDNQDYIESLRLFENRDNYETVKLTSSDWLGSDDNIWSQTAEGKNLDFGGAIINFKTGEVFASNGITPLGDNFTPAAIPSTFWHWYSVNVVPVAADGENDMTAKLLIVPAASSGVDMATSPRAPYAHQDKAIRIGQIAVQGGALVGDIESIYDANIKQKAVFQSEAEGRRFGVADIAALKATPPYDRHDKMLRLVVSDLQGRGVLYRYDSASLVADTTADPEVGEAPKVVRPDDLTAPEAGRWHTVAAMDIGVSVIRTDMIRDDNVTLAKLAHTDPHRVIGFNGAGTPVYLFELELTDGSAAQPTYSFASDQDTGIYRDGDGSIGWSSNGIRKLRNTWDGSNDYFVFGTSDSSKNIRIQALAGDSHIGFLEAYGLGGSGSGQLYVGESVNNGGGVMYNGDNTPSMVGRVDAIAHYRRTGGSNFETFWYRPTNDNVHFNGCIALKDNNGAEPNPEAGYLALCQDNDSLFMKTSGGTVINIPNQSEADARYLRRNASDTPSADNSFNLGSGGARWANIYAVTFQGRATSANWADLAERYESDEEIKSGYVVCLGGDKEITKSKTAHDPNVFGVISTDPAFRMNDNPGDDDKVKPFVALSGRVPCQVKGKIKKGERLVTSDIPGVAMRLDTTFFHDGMIYMVIGRALEDKDTDDVGEVEIVVGKN